MERTGDQADTRVGTYTDRTGRVRELRIEQPDPAVVAALRRMTPGERIEAGLRHSNALRRSVMDVIRHRHPDWTDAQVRAELLRRMDGRRP